MISAIVPNHVYLYGSASREKLSYEEVVARAAEQDRLVAEGKMEKPLRIIRDFTFEEKQEFENGISIGEYIRTKGLVVL